MAEELTAETFLRVWLAWERIQWPTVRAYLFAITRNLYFQQLRRGSRERPLDEAMPAAGSLADQAEAREELEQALTAMRELPELDRTALLLRAQEGLPYEEIAAILELPVATAKVKVYRARLRLAQIHQRSDRSCPSRKT